MPDDEVEFEELLEGSTLRSPAARHIQALTTFCTHCQRPMRGSAGRQLGSTFYPLCHPDEGMDCYTLTTVFGHQLVGCPCALRREQPDGVNDKEFLDLMAALGDPEDVAAVRPRKCPACKTLIMESASALMPKAINAPRMRVWTCPKCQCQDYDVDES